MQAEVWIVVILLSINAVRDIWRREIFLWVTAAGIIAGIVWSLAVRKAPLPALPAALFPGGLMLLISWTTEGKIGYGDGLTAMMLGVWTGLFHTLLVLSGALFAAGMVSMLLTAARSRIRSIPFVPFVLAAEGVCRILAYGSS